MVVRRVPATAAKSSSWRSLEMVSSSLETSPSLEGLTGLHIGREEAPDGLFVSGLLMTAFSWSGRPDAVTLVPVDTVSDPSGFGEISSDGSRWPRHSARPIPAAERDRPIT